MGRQGELEGGSGDRYISAPSNLYRTTVAWCAYITRFNPQHHTKEKYVISYLKLKH